MSARLSGIELAEPTTPSTKIRFSAGETTWLRPSEWVLWSYFAYTAALSIGWALPWPERTFALLMPVLIAGFAYAESMHGNKATGVAREWIPPGLVLVAYWQVNCFQRAYDTPLENRWIGWDRLFLDQWHARDAIEYFGPIIPGVLEFCYFMMYAIPPVCLWLLYRNHLRRRVDLFLFTFMLGTLITYALLPHFPTEPPRIGFQGVDLPHFMTPFRWINIWVANGYDIRTSVFPSGHVTAAFSAAFGVLLAMPEKKRAGFGLLAMAVAIALTTVYGRYHYAADAIAGFCISLFAGACGLVYSSRRAR